MHCLILFDVTLLEKSIRLPVIALVGCSYSMAECLDLFVAAFLFPQGISARSIVAVWGMLQPHILKIFANFTERREITY